MLSAMVFQLLISARSHLQKKISSVVVPLRNEDVRAINTKFPFLLEEPRYG